MEVEEREAPPGQAAEVATPFSDSEAEDDPEETFRPTEPQSRDTTAEEHQFGKDVQGIPWHLLNFTRQQYRDDRVRQYDNYMNLEEQVNKHKERLNQEVTAVSQNAEFFDFQMNQRSIHASIVHFQLRNLLWSTSNHDVFLSHQHIGARGGSVLHWNTASQCSTKVMDLTGMVSPCGDASLNAVQISTICVAHNIAAVGGFNGELIAKSLVIEQPVSSVRVSHSENSITNGIEIFRSGSGATCMLVSNNDEAVRLFDAARLSGICAFKLPWAANYAVACPTDPKLVGIVGDHPEGIMCDVGAGQHVETLKGHLDYSFAAAWHPDGVLFATGNQDCCTRIWDKRKLSESVHVLRGNMGAIRSLRFSNDGRFLAMAEPADFVHLLDTTANFSRSQVLDVFGDIAGIGFSPMTDTFFMAITLEDYSSLLTFSRRRNWASIHERNIA